MYAFCIRDFAKGAYVVELKATWKDASPARFRNPRNLHGLEGVKHKIVEMQRKGQGIRIHRPALGLQQGVALPAGKGAGRENILLGAGWLCG